MMLRWANHLVTEDDSLGHCFFLFVVHVNMTYESESVSYNTIRDYAVCYIRVQTLKVHKNLAQYYTACTKAGKFIQLAATTRSLL